MAKTGFTPFVLPIIGIVAIVGAILLALPATGLVGAILITGFLGGAICMHVRIGEFGSPPQILCIILRPVT